MCFFLTHTNVIQNPDPNDISLLTLTQRFERERELTQTDIKVSKFAIPLIALGLATVLVGMTYLVFLIPEAAALWVFTAMIEMVAGAFLYDSWKAIPQLELKLKKDIFEELLYADKGHCTQEKLALFQKYGKECEQLTIEKQFYGPSGPLGQAFHLKLGVPASYLFGIADRLIIVGSNDITLNAQKALCMKQIIKNLDQQYGNVMITTEPTSLLRNLNAIVHEVNRYEPSRVNDNDRPATRALKEASHLRATDANRNNLNSELSKIETSMLGGGNLHIAAPQIFWSIDNFAAFLNSLSNLKVLNLEETFRYKELFDKFEVPFKERVYVRSDEKSGSRLNVDYFPSIEKFFSDSLQDFSRWNERKPRTSTEPGLPLELDGEQ